MFSRGSSPAHSAGVASFAGGRRALSSSPVATSSEVKPKPPPRPATEPIDFPPTRTTVVFLSDGTPARWALLRNAYLHAVRHIDPRAASVYVACNDAATQALCRGLTHGDRHARCVRVGYRDTEEEGEPPLGAAAGGGGNATQQQAGESKNDWYSEKWKHVVNVEARCRLETP